MNKKETDQEISEDIIQLEEDQLNENFDSREEHLDEMVNDPSQSMDMDIDQKDEDTENLDPDYLLTSSQVVGYNSTKEQEVLYDFILTNFNPTTESILDLGCGRGDFLRYAERMYQLDFKYHGIDMNKQLIDVANQLSPDKTFTNTNWFSLDGNYAADWVLNINSTTIQYEPEGKDFDSVQALRNTINKMLELADTGIVISLLSTLAPDSFDEAFLVYDPVETLDWALNEFGNIGGNIKLDHSMSDAIFILTIYK